MRSSIKGSQHHSLTPKMKELWLRAIPRTVVKLLLLNSNLNPRGPKLQNSSSRIPIPLLHPIWSYNTLRLMRWTRSWKSLRMMSTGHPYTPQRMLIRWALRLFRLDTQDRGRREWENLHKISAGTGMAMNMVRMVKPIKMSMDRR